MRLASSAGTEHTCFAPSSWIPSCDGWKKEAGWLCADFIGRRRSSVVRPQGDKNSSSSASMARLNIEDAKTPQWEASVGSKTGLDASCRGLDHSSESHAQLSHELISFWGAACGKFRDVYGNRHTAAQAQK